MREDEPRGGLLGWDDLRHPCARDRGCNGCIRAAPPPGSKQPFNLGFRKVVRISDDWQKLQRRISTMVHAEPDGLNAVSSERRAELALESTERPGCLGFDALASNINQN